jgi:hypothetical protein
LDVLLQGSSPAALTAGILLLTRARSFGIPGMRVSVVGDAATISEVRGPAVLNSQVLASCGIGRELGQGALVVIPGPATDPLLVSTSAEGRGAWFTLDTTGYGLHPATRAFVRFCRDPRPRARRASRKLRELMRALGLPAEPALLDFLFSAPEQPLTRVGLGLRAGRAITGDSGQPLQRYLDPNASMDLPDPLEHRIDGAEVLRRHHDGELDPILSRLTLPARDAVDSWLEDMGALSAEDEGRDLRLVGELAELISHLAVLPPRSMLPPPNAASDSVAVGLGRALGATRGEHNAAQALVDIFLLVGGKFALEAQHAIQLPSEPCPETRVERWQWFARGVSEAANHADELWRHVMDMPS